MTRQKLPDVCDICKKDIKSETQYLFEVYRGRSSFGDTQIKGKSLDVCHPCFLEICEKGYKPEWKYNKKNPNYVAGSKEASKKYWVPVLEGTELDRLQTHQEKIEA